MMEDPLGATMSPAAGQPVDGDERPFPVVSQPGRARYAVAEDLGAGGMGQVVRVHDAELDRDVAMKLLRGQGFRDGDSVSRFLDEARSTARLEHPNIVPIHEVGYRPDGVPYFTMRLVQGKTLHELIEELATGNPAAHERLPFVRRLQLVQHVCHALSYAHAQGILHRDIKPANIMIGAFGEVVVMDWGLARTIGPRSPESRGLPRHPTGRGAVLGTPAFMPPEQAEGGSDTLDARSDVYAVGALMYALFTLRAPHTGTTPLEVLTSVSNQVPPAPEDLAIPGQPRVPREVSHIIMRAMARDPAARYPTAQSLADAIQAFLEGRSAVVCVHTAVKRGLNRLAEFVDQHHRVAILGLALVLVGPSALAIALLAALYR